MPDSNPAANDELVERARINNETAKIAWRELQRFFAQGHAVHVAPELDLVEVAYQVSRDNASRVESWVAAGQFGVVSDEQAREWIEANALMWAVVVRPWILVQPILQVPDSDTPVSQES